MVSLPMPELLFNLLGLLFSFIAVYYWVMLYKRLYKRKNELQGWAWLFASAFAILLLNISSTYMLFSDAVVAVNLPISHTVIDFNTLQVVEVLGRTIIVFSMTVGVYLLYNPLRKGFVYALMPVGLESSDLNKEKVKYSIETCASYLVPEDVSKGVKPGLAVADRSSSKSMQVFEDLISHGVYGLVISREYPANLRKNWKIENLPVIWLTTSRDVQAMENIQSIDPVDLVSLGHAVKGFIKKSRDSVVLLDGLEYLITQNSFVEVLKFIQSLNDFVAQNQTRLVIPLDYKAVSEKELHLLKRELCEFTVV